MIEIVLAFLFLSVLFYLVFAGADFGVGILELFSRMKNKRITKLAAYRIIGPVWEANHIWLILCIVILWIAFPYYYNIIVTQLHIPITLLLVGIIGRGTAFVFRHYDAYRGQSQWWYDVVFQLSSLVSVFFVGVCAGALVSGEMIHPNDVAGKTFLDLYVYTWLNPFAILMGYFMIALTAFIAAVFLSGDTVGQEYRFYLAKARRTNIYLLVFGGLIFIESYIAQRQILQLLLDNPLFFILFVVVGLLFIPIWRSLLKGNKMLPGFVMALQLFLILFVWSLLAFPNLIFVKNATVSILDNASPDSVFNVLGFSLLFAAVFVLPGLYHLFRTFGLLKARKSRG